MTGEQAHEHKHTIMMGNAPVVMMAGQRLPIRRACACGATIITGYYLYDPAG